MLSRRLSELVPADARVLDVGSGDGLIASLLHELRPDLAMSGVEVQVRPGALIPVTEFDGRSLPFDRESFDAVLFVDVLHHADSPLELLVEAARVARSCVIVKDVEPRGFLATTTLRFMDWVGNRRHGVSVPDSYWTADQWTHAFAEAGLTPVRSASRLGLYPFPLGLLFERGFHFLTRLEPASGRRATAQSDSPNGSGT